MKPIHFAALLILGAIWGASFLFIGVAVEEFSPPAMMFFRTLFGGLILVVITQFTRQNRSGPVSMQLRDKWHNYFVIGLFNSAIPFTLIAFSEINLTASLAAILNSTTPLFTALVASAWGIEQLTGRKIGGVILGIVGVMVLMGGSPLEINSEILVAVAASLLAAFCYGLGTVYASKHITFLPAIYASMIQLLSAAIILAPIALFTMPSVMPSTDAIFALGALIVMSTAFAYLLYFFLLREVGSTRTASVTFLVPMFGTIWGVAFLSDPFSAGMLLGMGIIFTSIGLVTGAKWLRQKSVLQPSTQQDIVVEKG
jgi:drug/metabolite transporter (DMT)-like permease